VTPRTGVVYLVGAGPGDPGLLTCRGAELLARADVVVHDRLSSPELLALSPPGAELLDVGKQPDDRGDQGAINELLVAKARAGRRVVRLKGGDPFVFGRGGEEAMALLAAGVPFEVVPGVTSAVAAPAAAGVPVTHRGLAGSVTVVAGHRRSVELAPEQGGTNWEALAAAGGTIVVLMGAAHRAQLAARLMAGGLAPATPVLAVRCGTEPDQTVVRTTLGELHAAPLEAPVAIVVGHVAGLDLSPRVHPPLFGRSVVVTRPAHQSSDLAARLRDLGARTLQVPVIMIGPPADGGAALAGAVGRLAAGAYEWVVLTSANAVAELFKLVPDARTLGKAKVAAVGPATAEALRGFRVVADLVPTEQSGPGLAAVFPAPGSAGAGSPTVLLPQAAGARSELRHSLEGLGWKVDAIEAYRTMPRPIPAELLRAAGRADAICFASPSAVASYLEQAEAAGAAVPPVVACIGPATAAAARARGLQVAAEAGEHTSVGLLTALEAALAAGGR
jgi:uroporphyrinogen III methyltransferase/synthase